MLRPTRVALAAALVAGLLLSGCTASHLAQRPGRTTSSPASSAHDLSELVRQLGACIHAHGAPDFPDPSIDAAGNVAFPADAPDLPPAAESACRAIIDRLPAPAATSAAAVSAATLRQWLAFASCMRRHGLPDWPDPQPDGSFDLPHRLRTLPSGDIAPAFEACRALSPNPDGKYDVSGSGR